MNLRSFNNWPDRCSWNEGSPSPPPERCSHKESSPSPLPSPQGEGESCACLSTAVPFGEGVHFAKNADEAAASDPGPKHLFSVAQVSNLLYRRFPIGGAATFRNAPILCKRCRLEALRYSRLETCATSSRRTPNRQLATGEAEAAFTLVEIMIAMTIGLMIMAAVMIFLQFGGTYLSGITAQSAINQQAGNAIEFIQMRVRLATSVSNSPSGNSLTLSFDDNPAADSDADGTAYNDRDHWERFHFMGINGSTNNASTNRLVYIPNLANPQNQQVLIPAGIRNLPGSSIFAVTNQSTVVIRFSIGDGYVADHYQGVDIQATAVPLNRPVVTNFVGIIP